jgi:hypothetical protein
MKTESSVGRVSNAIAELRGQIDLELGTVVIPQATETEGERGIGFEDG